jgi:hypothetical protein
VQQLRDSMGRRRLSPEWRTEAEAWISELRRHHSANAVAP